MLEKKIRVKVYRRDPSRDDGAAYNEYDVPFTEGMSALNALDYIYHNLDPTIAYYDHAGCALGICARCTGKINGKAGLLCQTPLDPDARVVLEPTSVDRVLRDLVTTKNSSKQN